MPSADTIYKDTIDVFYGGISDDIRIQKPEVFGASSHFDILTNPKRLVPYRAMVADEDTTYKIEAFAYGENTLLGLGYKVATTKIKIYQKTVGNNIASSWAAAAGGEDAANDASAVGAHGFLEYHSYVYGTKTGAGAAVFAWGEILDPGAAFTSDVGSPVPNGVQGIVTSDDLLLFPGTSGRLYMKDGAGTGPTDAWTLPLDLPNNRNISDLAEYGEYVAIATEPDSSSNSQLGSKVYLWDKVQSDPAFTIDWGEGALKLLANLEGTLIGISQIGSSSAEGILKQKLVVRQYEGGNEAKILFELEADDTTLTIYKPITKVKDGNRVLFGLKIKKDAVTYIQMASIGRKSSGYPWSFTLDTLIDNAVAITSIQGALKLGQTLFVAHNADGSVNRTDSSANYTTATYISQRLNGSGQVQDAARRRKELVMAGILTAPLLTGQSVSLYYRTDGNTSWTLIRTYAYGDDTTLKELPIDMGFEAGKDATPTDFSNYKELQFKATSGGGAEITGVTYAWKFAGSSVNSE